MRKFIFCSLFIILAQGNVIADEHSMGFVIPHDWAEFTDKDKELYVSGVLDGQIFMLYGASNPDLDLFLQCVKKEGIKAIINYTDLQLGSGEDTERPMPWAISKGVRTACKKHKEK